MKEIKPHESKSLSPHQLLLDQIRDESGCVSYLFLGFKKLKDGDGDGNITRNGDMAEDDRHIINFMSSVRFIYIPAMLIEALLTSLKGIEDHKTRKTILDIAQRAITDALVAEQDEG